MLVPSCSVQCYPESRTLNYYLQKNPQQMKDNKPHYFFLIRKIDSFFCWGGGGGGGS